MVSVKLWNISWPVTAHAGLPVNQVCRTVLDIGNTSSTLVEGTTVFRVGINPISFTITELLSGLLGYFNRGDLVSGCGGGGGHGFRFGIGCCLCSQLRRV